MQHSLNEISFDHLLRSQNPFEMEYPSLDIRQVKFITPAGMIMLAVTCRLISEQGRTPEIKLGNDDVASYLLRAKFIETIGPYVKFNPGVKKQFLNLYEDRYGKSPLILELTPIEGHKTVSEVLGRIVTVLSSRLGYDRPTACGITVAISEVAQNIYQHGGEGVGYIAMQAYLNGRTPSLSIALGDCGVGIWASLRRNPKHETIASDHEALHMALSSSVSEFDDPTRGQGLTLLLDKAKALGGTVQIRSGGAVVRSRSMGNSSSTFDVPEVRGVQVVLTLPTRVAG